MSQLMDAVDDVRGPESSAEVVPSETAAPYDPTYGQFDYAPVPVLAPISLVLGVCALIAFLGLFGIFMAAIGIMVGLAACWKIGSSQGGLAGMKYALIGLVLSATSALGGTALQVYLYQTEVPAGFERVSFAKDISAKAIYQEEGVYKVHPEVEALFDKPIFIKGFMYPTMEQTDLGEFLLLKDSGQCCFGGQPALQDMIQVLAPDGVDYYPARVAIAGRLKKNPAYQGGSLDALFVFEAEHFSAAQTSF